MATPAETSALYSARPTVLLEGRRDVGLSNGIQSLCVQEDIAGLYWCELTIGNWGTPNGNVTYLYFNRTILDFGKKIGVELGQSETADQVFEGRITALEGRFMQERAPEITVLAEDKAQDLRMIRRTRAFENMSDRDVIERIASEHGFQADIDIDGPTSHQTISQVNQSDLAFLRDRARAIDAELWVEGNTLRVQARSRRRLRDVSFTYGQRLREFSVIADLAHQATAVTIGGWDVTAKSRLKSKVDESAIRAELNSDELSGASALKSAFGERAQQVVHHVPLTVEEARLMAESEFRRRARRFVTGRALAEGDGRIRVGVHVELKGLGPIFNGMYYVTMVRHLFDVEHGYRTAFEVERAGIGQ